MKIELKEGERVDNLHRDGFRIIQNEKLFCFGMDAVLLTGFAKVREGENVLDLERAPELSRFFWRPRRKEKAFPAWRFQRKVWIWR